jgi:hypothetical protein
MVTDAGLMELVKLKKLGVVELRRTKVTDEGVKAFLKACPDCEVKH